MCWLKLERWDKFCVALQLDLMIMLFLRSSNSIDVLQQLARCIRKLLLQRKGLWNTTWGLPSALSNLPVGKREGVEQGNVSVKCSEKITQALTARSINSSILPADICLYRDWSKWRQAVDVEGLMSLIEIILGELTGGKTPPTVPSVSSSRESAVEERDDGKSCA